MTFTTNKIILYELFSELYMSDYHILSKWGIYIKNIKQVGVYSSNPHVTPPVGLITNSVIQRYKKELIPQTNFNIFINNGTIN
jgi:hypothetical protein